MQRGFWYAFRLAHRRRRKPLQIHGWLQVVVRVYNVHIAGFGNILRTLIQNSPVFTFFVVIIHYALLEVLLDGSKYNCCRLMYLRPPSPLTHHAQTQFK